MRVLLPPSETKRLGGGNTAFQPESLAFAAQLGDARARVLDDLVALSHDEELAAAALKVGVKARQEIALNRELRTSPTLSAIERYTGVLFDALDYETLPAEAQAWTHEHVFIQSALFGLISAGDEIPAYRLSASSKLEAFGKPRHSTWRAAHELIEWGDGEFVLDARSKDYASLAPLPDHVIAPMLHIVQRTEDGTVRALNHFNKAAKGHLVRALALSAAVMSSVTDFIGWAADHGFEVAVDESLQTVTFVTDIGVPARR